ncbi:hypothetical protein I79_023905 [Cricetulus griseus]|uniref:Uncharacterized protein n=1 Tax=Cricetulus griseus TaxID=10029 RepID=G3IJ73_CRIGR|nr:hypothetical protein I79_023905 [Cricetulus griseus]
MFLWVLPAWTGPLCSSLVLLCIWIPVQFSDYLWVFASTSTSCWMQALTIFRHQ